MIKTKDPLVNYDDNIARLLKVDRSIRDTPVGIIYPDVSRVTIGRYIKYLFNDDFVSLGILLGPVKSSVNEKRIYPQSITLKSGVRHNYNTCFKKDSCCMNYPLIRGEKSNQRVNLPIEMHNDFDSFSARMVEMIPEKVDAEQFREFEKFNDVSYKALNGL